MLSTKNYTTNNHGFACTGSNRIPERTKRQLAELIDEYPAGIWAFNLPRAYNEKYSINLDYKDLGFVNILELAYCITDVINCAQPFSDGKTLLLSKKHPLERVLNNPVKATSTSYENDMEIICRKPPMPQQLCSKIYDRFVPESSKSCFNLVQKLNLLELRRNPGDYEEVVVLNVTNPSNFIIRLRRNNKQLRTMMKALQNFYSRKDFLKLKIPPIALKKHLNVACMYKGKWHRAWILHIRADGYVLLSIYDYGKIALLHSPALHYLDQNFAILPAQTISCSLVGIKPNEDIWSSDCVSEFISLVKNKEMIATISSIDTTNNSLRVNLIDTNGPDDICINKCLIGQGLAKSDL